MAEAKFLHIAGRGKPVGFFLPQTHADKSIIPFRKKHCWFPKESQVRHAGLDKPAPAGSKPGASRKY
jgi:hypothetical protein